MAHRDTVIVDESTSPFAVLAALLFVVCVLFVGYLVFFNGTGL